MQRGGRNRTFFTSILILCGTLLAPLAVSASEPTPVEHGETSGGRHDSEFHRNHFAGIVGWSHKDTGKDAFTLGMEYSRWFTPRVGVGAYIELSEGDFNADTVGLVLGVRPTKNLSLIGGPGIERTLFEANETLWRFGAGYTFRPKGVSVAPVAWVDFVGGHEIYFLGVAVGKGF